jgi:Bcr/CflA subfamily drug resistance transporter
MTAGRPAQSPPGFWTLVGLTALAPLTLNMILPSLPAISAEMGVDYGTATLAVGAYLALTAFVQVIAGPLSDRFGRRPVVLTSLAIFTLASALCLSAEGFAAFLGARLAQGAVISCFAMALAITRDIYPREEAAARIGLLSMAMAVAPMLGPLLGGLLDAAFGWRAIFWAYLVAGAMLFGLCWHDLGETGARAGGGFRQMARALGTLLGLRRFWAFALAMIFSTGLFYVFLAGAPLVASQVFGLSPAWVGVAVGSVTGGFLAGSFLSARLAARVGIARMILAGRISATAGLAVGLGAVLAGMGNLGVVFGATLFVGIGNGLTMPSTQSGAMSLRPELAGSIAGITGALVVAGGAVLSTLTGQVLAPATADRDLLLILFLASLVSLAAALWLWRDDSKTAPAGAA